MSGYRWRIRVRSKYGRSQSWTCEGEAAARAEFDVFVAQCKAGRHPAVTDIHLERKPVVGYEVVEGWAAKPEGDGDER